MVNISWNGQELIGPDGVNIKTLNKRRYPSITYYWTVPLILVHSYLVGNLTNSKMLKRNFRTTIILTLLNQQFSNLLISQRDMSGPRLGALPNNTWSGGRCTLHRRSVMHMYPLVSVTLQTTSVQMFSRLRRDKLRYTARVSKNEKKKKNDSPPRAQRSWKRSFPREQEFVALNILQPYGWMDELRVG
jgi:hypothetical protein